MYLVRPLHGNHCKILQNWTSSNANTNINVEPSDDIIEDELDIDGDGQTVEEGDCDDNDPNIFSGVEETYYDGIDQNQMV